MAKNAKLFQENNLYDILFGYGVIDMMPKYEQQKKQYVSSISWQLKLIH